MKNNKFECLSPIDKRNKTNMKRSLLVIVLAVVFAATFVSAQGYYGCPMGGFGYSSGYGFAWVGLIFQLLLIVAIVLFIFWLIKQLQTKNRRK